MTRSWADFVVSGSAFRAWSILWFLLAALTARGAGEDDDADVETPEQRAETAAIQSMLEPFTGDLDRLVERRYIRMLVPFSRTHYFLDKGQQFGLAYEGGKQFEEWLNERLGNGVLKVQVAFIPVSRDRLLAALAEGRGDLAAGNLTITSTREEWVDFATPFASDVREVVVTAAGESRIANAEDLSGREVHVRRSSSYHESLLSLNVRLAAAGRSPVRIVEVSEDLEDEDLLEMIAAGLLPATVVDAHIAEFWSQVFLGLEIHTSATLRENGKVAWAVRKGCPKLRAAVSDFAKENRKGSLLFNLLYKKYLKSTKVVKGAAQPADLARFRECIVTFRKYGAKYEIPWLLLASLGYQESRLDPKAKSAAGAVGVMQVKPSTAEGKPIEIRGVETSTDRNVEAGTKYLRFIADRYVADPKIAPLERGLLVLASYNAGPTRIAKLRKLAEARGLDPNRWFGNVEVIVAREIGRETVGYVANIYKYFVAYSLVVERMISRGELERD